MKRNIIIIDEVPDFETLFQFRQELDAAIRMLTSLADEPGDTVQRATDLFLQMQDLYKMSKRVLLQ